MLSRVQKQFLNTTEPTSSSDLQISKDDTLIDHPLFKNQLKIREHFQRVKGMKSKILLNKAYIGIAEKLELNENLIVDVDQENQEVISNLIDTLENISCSDALYNVVKISCEEALDHLMDSEPDFFEHLQLWNHDFLLPENQMYYLQKLSNKIHGIASREIGIPIFPARISPKFEAPCKITKTVSQGTHDPTLRQGKGQEIESNLHPEISEIDGFDAIEAVLHEAAAHSIQTQLANILLFDCLGNPEIESLMEPFADDAIYVLEKQNNQAYVHPGVDHTAYQSSADERLAHDTAIYTTKLFSKYVSFLSEKNDAQIYQKDQTPSQQPVYA